MQKIVGYRANCKYHIQILYVVEREEVVMISSRSRAQFHVHQPFRARGWGGGARGRPIGSIWLQVQQQAVDAREFKSPVRSFVG